MGHHAEVKLRSWRCRVAEPMKRGAKDSETLALLVRNERRVGGKPGYVTTNSELMTND
ncbi:MAG: hypothetical protein VKL59_23985 [Nostocaceae cyanobacterium]|nr:hypothetical protein [Nostocaceae cyanobacterium]